MPKKPTTVVNCRTQQYDVYIGRPSIWGNPYQIGPDGTRDEVLQKFKQYLLEGQGREELEPRLDEMVGKRLGCYCAPKHCHGDLLAYRANHL